MQSTAPKSDCVKSIDFKQVSNGKKQVFSSLLSWIKDHKSDFLLSLIGIALYQYGPRLRNYRFLSKRFTKFHHGYSFSKMSTLRCYKCNLFVHIMKNCIFMWFQRKQSNTNLEHNKKVNVVKKWMPKNKSMFVQVVLYYENKDLWIIDSGCSKHMTNDKKKFTNLASYKGGCVNFGDNSSRQSKCLGSLMLSDKMPIHDVYYVKGLKYNLLSVSQIFDNDYEVLFDENGCQIKFKIGKIVAESKRSKGNVYNLKDITNTRTIMKVFFLWNRLMKVGYGTKGLGN